VETILRAADFEKFYNEGLTKSIQYWSNGNGKEKL
jgi:hypothetical protein